MRQILIEKYIEPSDVIVGVIDIYELWFDRNYDLHSFMGQPAEIIYRNKEIIRQRWLKKGIKHRDKNLPSHIYYYDGEITSQYWHKNGEFIKEKFY
jgi:ribosome biogenesis GTPase A